MGGTALSFFMADLPWIFLAIACAYLIGSIPFGLVLTRMAGLGDIRKVGSGNIGATNVLRTGNKGLALATLLLDGGKGAVAVLLAWQFGDKLAAFAALGAVLGHMFPVWLRFKGGKGVATAIGVFLGLHPLVGLAMRGTWLLIAITCRYSSVAALTAISLAPIYLYFIGAAWLPIIIAALIVVLVWIRHHGNLRRLLRGEEPKIGVKKKP